MAPIPEQTRPRLITRSRIPLARTAPGSPVEILASLDGQSRADRHWVRAWRRLSRERGTVWSADFFEIVARWRTRGDVMLCGAGTRERLSAALPLERRAFGMVRTLPARESSLHLIGDMRGSNLLWRAMCAMGRWHLLELEGIPETGVLVDGVAEQAMRDGCRVVAMPWGRAPYFPLARLEGGLETAFADNLRKNAARLQKLHFERITTADPRALEDLFAMQDVASGGAVADDPNQRGFLTEIAQSFARRRQLVIAFLRKGSARISGHLALEDGKSYALLAAGQHSRYAASSAADLLLYAAAEDARRRGLEEIEFPAARGTDDVGEGFAISSRNLVALKIYRGPLGRLRHSAEYRLWPAVLRWCRRARDSRPILFLREASDTVAARVALWRLKRRTR